MTGATRIAVAIVLAAAIIALALYARPIPDRYYVRGRVWIDTATGLVVRCNDDWICTRYDRNGNRQRIGRDLLAAPPATIQENGYTLTPVEGDPFANEQEPLPPGYRVVETPNETQSK